MWQSFHKVVPVPHVLFRTRGYTAICSYTQLAANLWAAVPGNVLITSLEIDVKAKNKLTARWLHWICFCCWNLIVVVMVTKCSPRGWCATSWQDERTRLPAERQPVSKQSATGCWQFSLNVAISQKIAAYHLFLNLDPVAEALKP